MKRIIQNDWTKFFIFLSIFFFANATAQYAGTLAGSTQGFADGVGIAAQFFNPTGIAVDAAGNIYIADDDNNRIRKITPAGVVSTLAGSGTPGFADGTGATARFKDPMGVAVDAIGNVYVADTYNNRIRKITPFGIVSTLAGGAQGDADGTGGAASFSIPKSVVVDASGTVFVADTGNHRIRKITAAGVVSTLAGSTQGFSDGAGNAAKFNNPSGVAIDASGTMFIGDVLNNRIRKLTIAGEVTTVVGSTQGYSDGSGGGVQFYWPWGVAIDAAGIIFVSDRQNHRIRKITGALGTTSYLQNKIWLYPNPASSMINIELEDTGGAQAKIYDMKGRALQSVSIIEKHGSIPVNNLANGVYMIQIITERGEVFKKIVKR